MTTQTAITQHDQQCFNDSLTTQIAIKTQQYRDKIQTKQILRQTQYKHTSRQTKYRQTKYTHQDRRKTDKQNTHQDREERRTNSHGPVASHGLTDVVGGGDVGHRLVILPVVVDECADILTMVLLLLTKGRNQDNDERRLGDRPPTTDETGAS